VAGRRSGEIGTDAGVSRIRYGRASLLPLVFVLLVAQGLMSFQTERSRRYLFEGEKTTDAPRGLQWHIGRHPAFTFGFRNVFADAAWLQVVQISGSHRMSRGDYARLDVLLQTVGSLDPRFDVPYLLGGLILGESPDHVEAALDTLERGRAHHPREWRLPFYVGYIKYFSLGDPIGSGRAIEEASRIPGSPPYLPLLASRMLSEGRETKTALALLDGILRQESDPARIEVLKKRIREVVVERDIQELERAVETYRRRHGGYPSTLTDLVRTGMVLRVPAEPNGGRYLLSPEGEVRSSTMPNRLKVFRQR
jgi:hypothetical protein